MVRDSLFFNHLELHLYLQNSGRGGRSGNNKPPPGAVNLERSYQICQAVIQNSPNRHQLRCQLKPPPALLGKKLGQGQQHPTPFSSVTQQQRPKARQQTVVLRHMIPSNSGGIPVSMAVLPSHPSHVRCFILNPVPGEATPDMHYCLI